MEHPAALRELCSALGRARGLSFVVVPGGGLFADAVRKVDSVFTLSSDVTHAMAILAMDQYGLMLSDLIPNSVAVRSLTELERLLSAGLIPVLLPSGIVLEEETLERSWEVTSDSISAFIAGSLRAARLVLVKDVDGVFTTDPKSSKGGCSLLERLTTDELRTLSQSCVDKAFPNVLEAAGVPCIVVNGLKPDRVLAAVAGEGTVGTTIEPRKRNGNLEELPRRPSA